MPPLDYDIRATGAEQKVAAVAPLSFRSSNVVTVLEELLEKAKAGEIKAVAVAYEYPNGLSGHQCAFGKFSNRLVMVGRLHAMTQHIVLNEVLEWSTDAP